MTAEQKVALEVARLDAILAKRGAFYEDEQARRDAFGLVALWMKEDEDERERIDAEADAAEQYAAANSPEQKTMDLFNSYRKKLKKEGRR